MTPDPKCTPEVARKVVYEFTMFGFLFENAFKTADIMKRS